MSNLARIIIEEYPKNNFAYQISNKLVHTDMTSPPRCFEEFSNLVNCLNRNKDYEKCYVKYQIFIECFNKKY